MLGLHPRCRRAPSLLHAVADNAGSATGGTSDQARGHYFHVPREEARRVQRHADSRGTSLSEQLLDQHELPNSPWVDAEDPIDDSERMPHTVWIESPHFSGLTGEETHQHMATTLQNP